MKLLYKSTLFFFLFSIIAFITGGIGFYIKAKSIIYNQVDAGLLTEKDIIEQEILETNEIPDFRELSAERQIKVKIYEDSISESLIIRDSTVYYENEDARVDYRMLKFSGNSKLRIGYEITIFQSVEAKQDLLKFIGLALFFLFLFLLVVSLVINFGISKNLWQHFNDSLNKIQKFDLSSSEPLNLPKTNIREFQQLNNVLTQMSEKMQKDYLNLKEFNENASHEIQSPLSIIRSHLELLMQNETLNESQLRSLNTIADSVTRLSKLNQGLILISKIDNQQFKTSEPISLNSLINKLLTDFEELINLKKIRIEKEFEANITIEMNKMLAEILISNLISNAIRYNFGGGFIRFLVSEKSLTVVNTGFPLKTDATKLFERFRKENHSSESVGLGLSIVKKIADFYGMKVNYLNTGDIHEVCIIFKV